MRDFTVIKRPNLNKLKLKYEHTKDKQFQMSVDNEYPIEIILGDNVYCRIRTEEVLSANQVTP